MDSYEIRIQQLRKLKLFSLFKLLIALGILIFLLVGGYFSLTALERANIIHNFIASTAIYFTAVTILISMILLFYFFKVNYNYKKAYLEIFINECKLEDIYLLKSSNIDNDERKNNLIKYFFLKRFSYLLSYSDATSESSFDIHVIKYVDHVKKGYGVVLSKSYNVNSDFFAQICNEDFYAADYYENKTIKKYGFTSYTLSNYHIYASDNKIYQFIKDGGKDFYKLSKLFKFKVNLVIDDNEMYIFLKDVKLTLIDNIFKKVSSNIFEEKFNTFKYLHQTVFRLISHVDNVFIINKENNIN